MSKESSSFHQLVLLVKIYIVPDSFQVQMSLAKSSIRGTILPSLDGT